MQIKKLTCTYNLVGGGLTPDPFLVGHTGQIEKLKVLFPGEVEKLYK